MESFILETAMVRLERLSFFWNCTEKQGKNDISISFMNYVMEWKRLARHTDSLPDIGIRHVFAAVLPDLFRFIQVCIMKPAKNDGRNWQPTLVKFCWEPERMRKKGTR